MKRILPGPVVLIILLVFSIILTGCLNLSGNKGALTLYLTDAPVIGLAEVNVTITKVSISKVSGDNVGESDWQVLNTNPVTVNLLNLRFDEQLLGTTQLPVGTYEQLRLLIDDSATVVIGTTSYPLEIPSAEKTGMKINLNNLEITNDATTELLMDVNLGDFINQTGEGQYKMRSTAIKVAPMITTGKINGQVTDINGSAITDADVIINIKQGDTVVATTYALKETLNETSAGNFIVNLLTPGTYSVEASATGYQTATVNEITVQAGQTTSVPVIQLAVNGS